MEIGISLGANLGNRLKNLQAARKRVLACRDITLVVQSPVYETEPINVPDADRDKPFLNSVLILETDLQVSELLEMFKRIELALGRKPNLARNAARPIDIDIIYAGLLQLRKGGITIPHPRWFQRRFVLQPLCDVRPDLVIPGRNEKVRQILISLPDKHKVKFFLPASDW